MKSLKSLLLGLLIFSSIFTQAQYGDSSVIAAMMKEEFNNSQLKPLAHELMDEIGPRLIGTSKLQKANDWLVAKYKSWGIDARNEKWGEWRGWERGISHIDMIAPWVKSLEGTQLAWSPSSKGKTITAEVIVLGNTPDSLSFQKWLPNVKGKLVMISMPQPTGRPNDNWEQYATKPSLDRMKSERDDSIAAWRKRISNTGYTNKQLARAIDSAGAAGIITNTWSNGFGVDKIFYANTKNIPTVDVSVEDYSLLYRLIQNGAKPKVSIYADSKETGMVPTFNTIAEIKGSEKPNEYVMLSAHLDSWDGATGATDNGTGTITMLEAMRILKKIYPNPKRTILVGHWAGEEEGLNGSRAFVEDHPEIVKNIQALFNQDNGTGRVTDLAGQGFVNAYNYLGRWLSAVPDTIKQFIKTSFPGMPGTGGSDFASFVAAGAPAFSVSSLDWSYGIYTWHTNRDTYDKIVFDDVKNNAVLTAILAYMASEDPETTSREKIILPYNKKTGSLNQWPQPKSPTRKGGVN